MNIFFFTSDLFVSVAATSIVSVMENNKHIETIHFYIVDDGISEEKRSLLTDLIRSYNREITYIPAPDPSDAFHYSFKDRYQMGHSYPRMCVGSLLPDSVERVLCLDSDTLILGRLDELWDMDMGENILAGVADCMNLSAYRKQFMLSGDEFYCNAGVFLVDLKKWRKEKIEEKISGIIHEKKGNVFFFEQTLMNYCCRGKIAMLHPKYNCYTLFWALPYRRLIEWRRPTVFYDEKQANEAKEKPVIIHFTRNFYMLSRPWVEGCDHPMTSEYIQYKQMTPWKELDADNRLKKQIIRYRLLHKIPQKTLFTVTSVIYNAIRPRIWWKNE